MNPLNKIPGIDEEDDTPGWSPDDPRPEWSEEDNEIEDRKPDLGEIEEDTSEL
jgi:hypothetical protein